MNPPAILVARTDGNGMAHTGVLILGGSSEGYTLAERLAADRRVEVTTSLAGVTRERRRPAGGLRVGGFGGPDGLAQFLAEREIVAVVDATHPFADRISANAAEAAAAAGVPILHLVRPAWVPREGDDWIDAADMEDAAAAIPARASPTFLTVGRTELAPFAHRRDIRFLARVIDPPEHDLGFADLELLFGRGPFDYEAERRLVVGHGVRCLVTKNSGGEAARAKLDAARDLGLPVVMVRRPKPPEGERAEGVAEALAWIERLIGPSGPAAVETGH